MSVFGVCWLFLPAVMCFACLRVYCVYCRYKTELSVPCLDDQRCSSNLLFTVPQPVPEGFDVKKAVDEILTKGGFMEKRARHMDMDDFLG